jgi:methylglutaconyl-CoA hydratase
MSFETVTIETDARGVATLTLNRAEKHNAMNAQMLDDITAAANQLAADEAVRVVILTGAGKSFCAGGDLAWMRQQMDMDAETRARESRKLAIMLKTLNEMPKPLIGRVQGNAFGGGVGMASVCDVTIGADTVTMGLTEVKLGLIPANIGPYVVSRMGEAKARRVFFSGRLFKADEAVTLGLLAKAVPMEELDAAVEAEVAPYLIAAPGAVAAAKALAQTLGRAATDEQAITDCVNALVTAWEGDEAPEGIAAFFEKRKAAWIG